MTLDSLLSKHWLLYSEISFSTLSKAANLAAFLIHSQKIDGGSGDTASGSPCRRKKSWLNHG
jgi:hypothetical protein